MTQEMPRDEPGRLWWRDSVGYQVYPRSFADSNGDGVGDLPGVIAHLDHLQWLGVEVLWLSPVMVSPNFDYGYDVADYLDVDPSFGTLADADRLIAEASARGIRVLMDLVPNHTSSQHPWFVDARASRDSPYRDFYVWHDGRNGGASPPNNWVSAFGTGEPAWSFDDTTGQWYLHQFVAEQPDLNWWNPKVRDEFDRILRFWFDRGVAGFRIDVVHAVVKDADLRDNPPADETDHWFDQLFGQKRIYNQLRPEVHDVIRRWRGVAESYDPPRMLLGETHLFDYAKLATFYGRGDELNLAFNFLLPFTKFDAAALCDVVERTEAALPADAWPSWPLGNHDENRYVTRWCDGDPRRVRTAMMIPLTLKGTPFIYYGDEIGMPDTEIPADRTLDPVGRIIGPTFGRDPERTPMHWAPEPGGGFTTPSVEPWLPFGDYAACNVADQQDDPGSILRFARDLIALRRRTLDLHRGAYRTVAQHDGLWAWQRGEHTVVAVNLSDGEVSLPLHGTVMLATDRALDGANVVGELTLAPWQGAIVDTHA